MKVEELDSTNGRLELLLSSPKERCGLDILWIPVLDEYFKKDFLQVQAICMNLKDIHYIDSSALWKLVDYTKNFKAKGISFSISHVNEHIMRILNLTRLLDKINVIPQG